MKTTVSPVRHIAKAITYRILGTLTSFFVGWAVTSDMHIGVSIGVIDFLAKTLLYYLHERAWYKFSTLGVHYIEDENSKCSHTE